ncbi:IclR family transcriptional regulator [Pararhizobium arenae]|uniref:IclR family transcriptional regulator n=1 Tax=Pararhizobium arenae TaxID=1856850 RepID=UPI00094B5300|nr:IclR family transcriptional regulator [Pararhizobium arenae]
MMASPENNILAALRLFTEPGADNGIRVTDAANALGVNKSTASRTLALLKQTSFLVADADTGRYFVGPACVALASRFSAATIAHAIEPILHELAVETRSTAQIGMRADHRVVFIGVDHGRSELQVAVRPGDQQFLHVSAVGKAILSTMADADFEKVIQSSLLDDGSLPRVAPKSIVSPDVFRDNIREARAAGFAVSDEEGTQGAIGIAASIPGVKGVEIALGVAFPANDQRRSEIQKLATKVKDAASAAAEALIA